MRHLIAQPFVILSSAMTLACVIAGPAAAQQAPTNGAGLRYLSWPGKPAVAASSPAAIRKAELHGTSCFSLQSVSARLQRLR